MFAYEFYHRPINVDVVFYDEELLKIGVNKSAPNVHMTAVAAKLSLGHYAPGISNVLPLVVD